MIWLVKKYGQITQVYVDDKLIYNSGNTVKTEIKNLRALVTAMGLQSIEIVEG